MEIQMKNSEWSPQGEEDGAGLTVKVFNEQVMKRRKVEEGRGPPDGWRVQSTVYVMEASKEDWKMKTGYR